VKYIIRSGKVREQGRYFVLLSSDGFCMVRDELSPMCKFAHRGVAKRWLTLAEQVFGEPARIVRLLSHEEAKEKAKASELREMATHVDDEDGSPFDWLCSNQLEAKANELWPVKRKKA
jgi:hypothetical protein